MHLTFADLTGSAADRDIFHRTAESAHGVTFKVSQHQHRVVIDDAFAHRDFFEMESVTNRQIDITVLIHDIDRAERPAVNFKGLSMIGSVFSSAAVQGIRFNDRAIGNGLLQGLDHVTRKNIGTVRFSGV